MNQKPNEISQTAFKLRSDYLLLLKRTEAHKTADPLFAHLSAKIRLTNIEYTKHISHLRKHSHQMCNDIYRN